MSLTELNKLEKLIIRAVIENTIDQLAIVGGTIQISLPSSSHPSSQVHQNASQRPLEELILKEHRQHQKQQKNTKNPNEMPLKLLSTEVSYVQSVLEETLEEVEESGTFLALRESVAKSRERNKEKNEIGEEEQRSREEMTRLREAIDKAKLAYEQDVEQQNMEIANLKDTLLEARRASKGQERYTEQLEVVREEESTRSMMKREQDLVSEMNRLKTEIAHENRVNMEVESWLKDRNTYLTSLHHFWTKKLNEDVPAKEAELQKLKDARNRDRKAYLDAKERIEVAEKFIDKTKEQLKKARYKKELLERQTKAAIKIQSWWRMIMVKRGLGQYKKKKKPLEKKDDKKGKKK